MGLSEAGSPTNQNRARAETYQSFIQLPWLSNQDWTSPTDPAARIAKLKDGRTRLAYKPEHAVDLDTGAIVAAAIHAADEGDTTTLPETLKAAEANLAVLDAAPTAEEPAELV